MTAYAGIVPPAADVDFDTRLFMLLLADIKYTRYVNSTTTDMAFNSVADYFMLTTSPYVSIGFKL